MLAATTRTAVMSTTLGSSGGAINVHFHASISCRPGLFKQVHHAQQ